MTDQYPSQPQPGPAGWGQPGYQPPPGPPPLGPKPPQRRRTLFLALAGVGAVLVIIALVVAGATSDDNPTLKEASATTAQPVTTTSPGDIGEQPEDTSPETTEATEVWKGAVGDGAVVAIEGEDAAELTLAKVDAFKTASPYGTLERARNGWLVKSTMRFKALKSGVDVNVFDFYVRTSDGRRFDPGDGNALGVEGDNGLESTTLTKGEKLTATMAFDVPSRHGALVYAPGDEAIGEWRF
jgi:hypothetical protein